MIISGGKQQWLYNKKNTESSKILLFQVEFHCKVMFAVTLKKVKILSIHVEANGLKTNRKTCI